MSLISVNNLVRYYGTHCAVDDISFELAVGDILGFLGPNGAGKSTTMQILSGNLAPSAGEIRIDGIDLLDAPLRAKMKLGYLPETPPLYKEMNVDEYLSYCAQLHRVEKNKIDPAVALAKDRCGLNDTGKRIIGNLSKGYQQRVGIAQAILHAPKIIILDEPTVGLDPIQIREIRELISELGKEHGVILSTHILPEVQAVCNRVQIINNGRLVFSSNMEQLLNRQKTDAYEVSFARSPSIDKLDKLAFITNVEQINETDFIIHTNTITAEEIANAAAENNWGLYKLKPTEQTLEQVFVDLTLTDNNSENTL